MIYSNQKLSSLIVLLLLAFFANAQTKISGKVTSDGESLIGANVLVIATAQGTSTDVNGNFELETDSNLPFEIEVSYTGYDTKTITVTADNKNDLMIELTTGGISLDQVVVGASRHSERFVEAPVTIEKIDGAALLASSAEGTFESLSNLKGVQVVKGSISGPSLNTRGFANGNNLRFLMHLDGMDVTSPGFGVYANVAGVSNLDVQSIEIIPGSSSALYGANAFNGIMLMKSKDPFIHQGVSAQIKTGVSNQSIAGTNPYNNFSIRIAKAFNNKLAFKVDYEGLFATDWVAQDFTQRDRNIDPLVPAEENPAIVSADQANYDGVTIHGDADAGGFTRVFRTDEMLYTSGGDSLMWAGANVHRTGYTESEIFDPAVSNHRLNAGLYYKINEDWQLDYVFKYGLQDLVVRHTTNYPFFDFNLTQHKVELKGQGLTARFYSNAQQAKETWTTVFLAASIQTQLLSNGDWKQRFVDAYAGEVSGVSSGSIEAARAYADDGMAPVGSAAWNAAKEASLASTTTFDPEGVIGSRLAENSSLWHGEAIYDFGETMVTDPSWTLQLGASYRQYNVNSGGAFFNDNRLEANTEAGNAVGYEGNIPVTETGIFGQIAKKMMDDRLNLSFVGRINGHSNYDVNFTPQLSAVFSPDANKNHNIRASFTTGVRNPGLQEQYINFLISPVFVILGGTDDNFDNYYDPFFGLDGDALKAAFEDQLGYVHQGLEPERNTTFEIGYKGLLASGKLLLDANFYRTQYDNLVERSNLTIVTPAGAPKTHAVYANLQDRVNSTGFGLGLEYAVSGIYRIYGNYQFNDFEVESTETGFGFVSPAFNTPKNRINLGVARKNTKGGFGFDIAGRYVSEYDYISPLGKGFIPSFFTVDASVSYKWKDFVFSVAGSNIVGPEYRTVYGGPEVGRIYTLGILYDMAFKK